MTLNYIKNKLTVAEHEALVSISICEKFLGGKTDIETTVNLLLMHADMIEASLSPIPRRLENNLHIFLTCPQKERRMLHDMMCLAKGDIETLGEVMKTVTEKYDCGELNDKEKAKSIVTILEDLFLAFAIEYNAIMEAAELIKNN